MFMNSKQNFTTKRPQNVALFSDQADVCIHEKPLNLYTLMCHEHNIKLYYEFMVNRSHLTTARLLNLIVVAEEG